MSNFVPKILSVTLGLFFILIGLFKLTPSVSTELYDDMRKLYIKMAKVFPLVKTFGFKLYPHMYRRAIGTTEVTCGAVLAFIPGPLKEAANVVMVVMMSLEIYSHYVMDDKMQRMSLPLVFLMLLACRLIMNLQIKAREMEEAKKLQRENVQAEQEKKQQ